MRAAAHVAIAALTALLWLGANTSLWAQQSARRAETPASVLTEARTLQSAGNAVAGLARIDRFLDGAGRRSSLPDRAILHLEGARLALAAGTPEQAERHLDAAESIASGSAFRPQPLLQARLQRELARQRERLGDLSRANDLLSAALPTFERGDAVAAAEAMNARGVVRLELLLLDQAQADFRRSLVFAERGQAPIDLRISILSNLTLAAAESGQLLAARVAAMQARQLAQGSDRLLRIADFANAQVLMRELDIATAESILALVAEQAAEDDPLRGHSLMSLANARFNRGRMAEAAEAATQAVEAYRRSIGERHPGYARALHTLGTALAGIGDTQSAEAALKQAKAVQELAFGQTSIQFQASEIELAWLDIRAGRFADADNRGERALRTYALTPPHDARPIGLALVTRGLAAEGMGDRQRAVGFYRQGQARIEQARGPNSPDLGFSLVRLGRLLTRTGAYRDAAPPLDRAIGIYEAAGGAGTVRLADAITARAELRQRSGERRGALDDARRALALLRDRVTSAEQGVGAAGNSLRRGARELLAAQARILVALRGADPMALNEAFHASQESLSSRAADALRRSALRRAAAGGELGRLLSDREASAEAMQQADSILLTSATTGAPLSPSEIGRLREAREDAHRRIRAIDAAMEAGHPRFARYLRPVAVDIAQVQDSLATDEAVVAPIVTDDGILVWGIRKGAAEAVFLPITAAELSSLVERLRFGLDLDNEVRFGAMPPFDVIAARAFHDAIFLPLERIGLFEGIRHLIVVPDGGMQSLPPQVLLDERQRWLIQRFAVTIAPTIGAFLTARGEHTRPSTARMGFLGVGDPDFSGFVALENAGGRGPPPNVRHALARITRLPDTTDELRQIAAIFGEGASRLLLGEEANKRALSALDLRDFRNISFATHALMAGHPQELTESVVVLAPTRDATPWDGLLTTSDVASLDLDADLVLLSACNTAAPGGGAYAEGMSGLTRAFLQAGARSLLVSHWAVSSEATVRLMTEFVQRSVREPGRRQADALQGAIMQLIGGDNPTFRGPAYWGPFVYVGG